MGAASPWNSTNPITPSVRSTVALAEDGSNLTNTYPEKSGTEITFWRSLQRWLSSITGRNVSIPLFCIRGAQHMPDFLGRYSSCGISFQTQNDSITEVA